MPSSQPGSVSVVAMAVRLAVFCGSNVGASPEYIDHAARLGSALAERGIGIVYGGGHVGLMGAVADSAIAGGGDVVGVITEQLVGAEIAHGGLTSLEVVDTMHGRKARMCDLADGFIVLPGGYGTLDEVLEVLTWNQLGMIAKPVVFLDIAGYFGSLFEFFDTAVDAEFVHRSHRALARRATTVDDAIDIATAPVAATPPKWIDREGSRA